MEYVVQPWILSKRLEFKYLIVVSTELFLSAAAHIVQAFSFSLCQTVSLH
jgi:hypothetical protein